MSVNQQTGIKSIQRVLITFPAGASLTATATISSVNTAKAQLRHLGDEGVPNSGYEAKCRLWLNNATTIGAERSGSAANNALDVTAEITEWY